MATVTGLITVNGKQVLEVDADPSAAGGTPAPIASLAMYDSGTIGTLWVKTGALDTDWKKVDVSDQDWSLLGNNLTGGTFDTPNEQFGSLNDYDVKFIRNNTELARLVSQGLLVGLSANAGGRLQVQAAALGDQLFRQQTLSGDASANVIRVSVQRKVQTTDNVVTTIADIAVPTDNVMKLNFDLVARQHGGVAGTIGHGAAFERTIMATNISGVVNIKTEQNSFTSRDAGFTMEASTVSGTNIRTRVKGETNKNIAWYAHYEFMLAVN